MLLFPTGNKQNATRHNNPFIKLHRDTNKYMLELVSEVRFEASFTWYRCIVAFT